MGIAQKVTCLEQQIWVLVPSSSVCITQFVWHIGSPVGQASAGLHTDIAPLTTEQYDIIAESLKVLSPFSDATEEKRVLGSKVIPLLSMLRYALEEDVGTGQTPEGTVMAESLRRQLKEKLCTLQRPQMSLRMQQWSSKSTSVNPQLEYWERQKQVYPNLYKLAVAFLCTPASSVPCERVFSKAGEILSKKRNCLKPSTVEKLFLNEKYKISPLYGLHFVPSNKHIHITTLSPPCFNFPLCPCHQTNHQKIQHYINQYITCLFSSSFKHNSIQSLTHQSHGVIIITLPVLQVLST